MVYNIHIQPLLDRIKFLNVKNVMDLIVFIHIYTVIAELVESSVERLLKRKYAATASKLSNKFNIANSKQHTHTHTHQDDELFSGRKYSV